MLPPPAGRHHCGLFPIILTAPCVPAIGILHTGRKGTATQLLPAAIALMCQEYDVSAKDMFAAIGPGIGGCCYEVDDASAEPFMTQFPVDVGVYWPSRPGPLYLNLQQALVLQLCSAGVPSRRVWSADLCKACPPEWFYSYRRDGPQSGRMLNVVMMEANMPPAFH